MARRRLDDELVRRGLAADRAAAGAAIESAIVTVAGAPALKASRLVDRGESIEVRAEARFVGRGGDKLDGVLDSFGVDVEGRVCLDAGSSTGGFTDCLIQRGAARVVAVDIGTHQLHERLRADPRVEVHEQTDIRDAERRWLGSGAEVVVGDLSFVSLASVVPALVDLGASDADMVLLVKPQFEVESAVAARTGGVVVDPRHRVAALQKATGALRGAGAVMMGAMASPLLGARGNAEFFVHAASPPTDRSAPPINLEGVVAQVTAGSAGDRPRPGATR